MPASFKSGGLSQAAVADIARVVKATMAGEELPETEDRVANPTRPRDMVATGKLPLEVKRQIGMILGGRVRNAESLLDHALFWAAEGVAVFPVSRYLGKTLTPDWHVNACRSKTQIIRWWSEHPQADIAAVPDKSGCFVIVAEGEAGVDTLAEFETKHGNLPATFRYDRGPNRYLWLAGDAVSRRNSIGPGVHTLGQGRFVYMPPSLAPCPNWGDTLANGAIQQQQPEGEP